MIYGMDREAAVMSSRAALNTSRLSTSMIHVPGRSTQFYCPLWWVRNWKKPLNCTVFPAFLPTLLPKHGTVKRLYDTYCVEYIFRKRHLNSAEDQFLTFLDSGFALPVAIVAKCEEKIFLAQKKIHLAKTSGKKKFSSQKMGILISPIWAILCHLIAN